MRLLTQPHLPPQRPLGVQELSRQARFPVILEG